MNIEIGYETDNGSWRIILSGNKGIEQVLDDLEPFLDRYMRIKKKVKK